MIKCSLTRITAAVVVALITMTSGLVVAAELSAAVHKTLRMGTFEVVQLKPLDGAVEYERPLPMDLMPYQERTDKYRSVGTAFAIAANRYVTASHVIMLGLNSQFGPPALRDAAGNVYAIDKVLAFSDREDFVIFSLREQPKEVKILVVGAKLPLNEPVFAVGNALGEGVVTRDGVYTSDTPEELDGEWNWMRFSAAASPGNSGGPLVDDRGQVIGVVLRKSPSENLNYALPISQVLHAKQDNGRMSSRAPFRQPMMEASITLVTDEHFPLPKSLPDFYQAVSQIILNNMGRGVTQLLNDNAAHLFPHGPGSERLLHYVKDGRLPVLIHESQNGIWSVTTPKPRTVQLERNGVVILDNDTFRLRAPDDVSIVALHDDSKLFMDLLLRAYSIHRAIGSDSVRVTSLGKATEESIYTDAYGRVWQLRSWAIPYADSTLTIASMPTPEGAAGGFFVSPTSLSSVMTREAQVMLDYIYVTLEGNLGQWQIYLAQKSWQPKIFQTLEFEIDPDRQIGFRSRRMELKITPALFQLSKETVLRLLLAFYRDGDAAVCDIGGMVLRENSQTQNWFDVLRKYEPSSELPENFQSEWRKLKNHSFPYDAKIANENGQTRIEDALTATGAADTAKVRYELTITSEGVQPQEVMSRKLDLFQHQIRVLEQ